MIDETYHLALWKREVMNQSVSEMLYELDMRDEYARAQSEYVESMRISWDEPDSQEDGLPPKGGWWGSYFEGEE